MTSAASNVFALDASLRLVAPDATASPVLATLVYRLDDPVAVQITFHPNADNYEPVTWWFSRELLINGLDQPTGEGDVRVWPWATPRGDFVALALSSPDGNALFEVPRELLVRFLRRSYRLFPRTREETYSYFDTAAADETPASARLESVRPLPYMLTRAASLLAGSHRSGYLETWLADLQGDPELGRALNAYRQLRLAVGFVIAAARFRIQDLTRMRGRITDHFVTSELCSLGAAATVTLAAACQLWAVGGLTRVWENGENLAAIGGTVWGIAAILRRHRAGRRDSRR